jgi:translation initiation factor 1 (eIF-1/SUI1)
MDERKKILKEIKKKIGGGGSLIQGIVELQGSHADVVLKTLKSKGYVQAAKQK